LQAGQFDLRFIHLIFDPGKKSHPEAEAIHGYSDWVLRHQEPFDKQAQLIVELVELADLVLAHNAPFDVEFVNRELTSSAKPPISKPSFCTMLAYRERVGFGSSKLSEATARIGLARAGRSHSALEDAWLAMMLYLWLQGCPYRFGFDKFDNPAPANMREVPPALEGPLPRRKRRRSPSKVARISSSAV
jgi:DNA polymerase-3 subunit epsilon